MTVPGKRWRHVIINTRCSWLHGDVRGFRNRRHRIHCSGDYKNPPPREEHEGLRDYHAANSGDRVVIPPKLRCPAGRAFLARLQKRGCRVLAVAVSGTHLHSLVELPDDRAAIRRLIGFCKRYATDAMKPALERDAWAEGGEFKPIKDLGHQINAYDYILTRQGTEAWTWSDEDGEKQPGEPKPARGTYKQRK